ncbi:C39 family peptidase [Patescibacteria group bacterium]|nr:C39 family peptidase [Patescibacteria group bacterium]
MVKLLKVIIFSALLLAAIFFIRRVNAVECDLSINPSNLSQNDLNEYISKCQVILNNLQQTAATLSQQKQYIDTQITLTLAQIQETEQKIIQTQKEIDILGSRIEGLDTSLNTLSTLLINRVVQSYKQRSISLFSLIFDSNSASELLEKIKYIKTARDDNQKLLVQVQEAKSNFEEQKNLREEKKTELNQLNETLTVQQQSLTAQKLQKQKLLDETNNDEATFQRLLAQAKAQLASFGRFVQSQGGASLLSNQTVCDDWGCYYNQRDSQWGNNSLNGTGYTLASDGCLITSMAMIYTHYGYRNVTPQTINNNPQNFASYYPAYLNRTITANGVMSTRISSSIDNELSAGRPVVVGIGYNGCNHSDGYYADHFVVLTSGSNGNYKMNDPFIPNGHNISFSDHYSSICEIDKVSM